MLRDSGMPLDSQGVEFEVSKLDHGRIDSAGEISLLSTIEGQSSVPVIQQLEAIEDTVSEVPQCGLTPHFSSRSCFGLKTLQATVERPDQSPED
jgi:hypothetical protein